MIPAAHSLLPVPVNDLTLTDPFWGRRREVNRTVTLEAQYLNLDQTGRIENFSRAASRSSGPFQGQRYDDSDVYKWLEAASHALRHRHDEALAQKVQDLITTVAAAQEDDGYLGTYITLVAPEGRFRNLGMGHELYCAGHLIEAAVAHFEATRTRALLDVAVRFADCILRAFGSKDSDAIPGHPQIERALWQLSRVTGQPAYAELAARFLDRRGRRPSRFERELGDDSIPGNHHDYRMLFLARGRYSGRYAQDHAPLVEQTEVVGHAVRAMYLFSAWAEQTARSGDPRARSTLDRLFDSLVQRRTYLTGGIGSARANEGFTQDYDLPSQTAYAETCAAIGLVFFSYHMALLRGDPAAADVLERTLHNGVLAGASLDGRSFFYENPLASAGDHHRREWFDCACCPPNFSRLVQSLERYAAGVGPSTLALFLYLGCDLDTDIAEAGRLRLRLRSGLPYEGWVRIEVVEAPAVELTLRLREPQWCGGSFQVQLDGEAIEARSENGVITLRRTWRAGQALALEFGMPILLLEAHPRCENLHGKVALQRGPLVYCAEDADHDGRLADLFLDPRAPLQAVRRPELWGGTTVIEGRALRADRGPTESLYTPRSNTWTEVPFTAIPYFGWDHRGAGAMRVWIPLAPRS